MNELRRIHREDAMLEGNEGCTTSPGAGESGERAAGSSRTDSSVSTTRERRRRRGRRRGGLIVGVFQGVFHRGVPVMNGLMRGWFKLAVRVVLGKPVQTGLLVANIFLVKFALTSLRRARFAAAVRVVKDLKNADDLRYLLGQLPPWISSPEWEAGKPAQELLGLLWPALNSTICLALKNVIEDRMQSSAEYGHIKFSRFSLGRNPPVICGIKAVPLHEEDLLALVVDLDVRWAGEPDVVLHLTKVSRATLGLKNLQISTMVRLVFSPIIEDPPFLQRMTVSLLNKPLIDFNLRALGGPDIMSLPAISSWLHAAILNVTDRFIVWPKEVSVPLVPNLRNKNLPVLSPISSSPLGVLVVRVEEAKLQKRRSTFLGRYKLPNPRIAMVTPKDGNDGVPQMTLTTVKEKTLFPSWRHSRAFVVGSQDQPLRFLLSHRRVENFFGADMPLGSAEVDVSELLHGIGRNTSVVESGKCDTSTRSFKSCMSTKSKERIETDMETYESASSGRTSPVHWEAVAKHVAWASPTVQACSPFQGNAVNPLAEMVSEGNKYDIGSLEKRVFKDPADMLTDMNGKHCPWTPPTKFAVPWESDAKDSDGVRRLKNSSTRRLMENKYQHGISWIDINSSPAMTMSGLVANALQPTVGGPPTPFENNLNDAGTDTGYGKSLMSSIKSFMMKSAFQAEYDSDNESVDDCQPSNQERLTVEQQSLCAKVKISYRWIPVTSYEPIPQNIGRKTQALPTQTAGVLGLRVAFTKIDYGDNPPNPILSFSLASGPSPSTLEYSTMNNDTMFSEFAQKTFGTKTRVFSTDCQVGHRPGVLLWGQVFHIPVWRADTSKVRVELGNISSGLKLSSYGTDLFLLEASGGSFDDDVEVEASANIPLKDVLKKGIVEGNYRLREAKTEKIAGVNDDQRLDIGRVVLSLAWYPFRKQDEEDDTALVSDDEGAALETTAND